ncbi:MAG: chemotaxis protein CheB [Magnetococcales bacterium]|nr:chemotaxis protein CheB [Magnetococcales bacterium]
MKRRGRVIVFGCSTGGVRAMQTAFGLLPVDYPWPIVGVCHLHAQGRWLMPEVLARGCQLKVQGAVEKERLQGGHLYLAPPGYHLLLERDRSCSLTVDEKVNGSRPAIDPLFESAADSLGDQSIAVILSGANRDGAEGAYRIAAQGGLCVIQDPNTAEAEEMPRAALAVVPAAQRVVVRLEEIGPFLQTMGVVTNG